MKTLKVKWKGFRPLVMANPQTVDIVNHYAVRSRALNSELKKARKKEDEDKLARLSGDQKFNDFCSSSYFDEEQSRFYLPDTVILACIKESAKSFKQGKDVDRAVIVSEERIPIDDVPPAKSLQDAYSQGITFQLAGPCKVPPKTGAMVWKMRCMMPTGWTVTFGLEFEPDLIEEKTLRAIIENAGVLVGVGGWRPKFGRFAVDFL